MHASVFQSLVVMLEGRAKVVFLIHLQKIKDYGKFGNSNRNSICCKAVSATGFFFCFLPSLV